MKPGRSSGAKQKSEVAPGPDLFTFAAENPAPPPRRPKPPPEPIVVSLTPESYRWFAEGAKTWEVRRHGKDFTEREIFPGRKIELRRGHRPEDALNGVIARVAVADDLPSLLDQIPYAAIIPEVGSVDEALAILRRLVGAAARGGLIAFEVALERHGG